MGLRHHEIYDYFLEFPGEALFVFLCEALRSLYFLCVKKNLTLIVNYPKPHNA